MCRMTYEEKIKVILEIKFKSDFDKPDSIEAVKTWLRCEFLCDNIHDNSEYERLLTEVDKIADQIFLICN